MHYYQLQSNIHQGERNNSPLNNTHMKDTLAKLEERILTNEIFGYKEVTVKTVGLFLCGMDAELANQPFSQEFLENVAYNSKESMHAIL